VVGARYREEIMRGRVTVRSWLITAVAVGLAFTMPLIGQNTASASTMAAPMASVSTGSASAAVSHSVVGGPFRSLDVVFAPPCKSEANRYIICFSLTQIDVSNSFRVHVGIDVDMSQRDAQNIIDAPGEEFSATLCGADSFFDDTLTSNPVTWSSAWEGGPSAEFDTTASGGLLDEDWDGDDEVFARVWLYVPSTGRTRSFRTNEVSASL
jgi:hypothetical protein